MSDSPTVLREAAALVEAGTPAEAVRRLVAWTSEHPDDAAAWELLAKVHFNLRHWLPARMAAAQVTHLRPSSASAWCNLGTILRKMDRPREAEEAQRRALGLDPAYARAASELAKLQKGSAPGPEGTPPAEQLPAVDTVSEFENPYHCLQCRRKIPRAVSDENDGLCGTCLREHIAPGAEVARRPSLFGVPVLALAAAVLLVLALGTTFALMGGRLEQHPRAESSSDTGGTSASRGAPAATEPRRGSDAATRQAPRDYRVPVQTPPASAQAIAAPSPVQTAATGVAVPSSRVPSQAAATTQPRMTASTAAGQTRQAPQGDATRPQSRVCQLTVVANRAGLEVLAVDAMTGTTGTDAVSEIIGNPAGAARMGAGPGASFAARSVLGADGMAQLSVPWGVPLKVEVRSATVVVGAPGGMQGMMKQQTVTIPQGARTYTMRFVF